MKAASIVRRLAGVSAKNVAEQPKIVPNTSRKKATGVVAMDCANHCNCC